MYAYKAVEFKTKTSVNSAKYSRKQKCLLSSDKYNTELMFRYKIDSRYTLTFLFAPVVNEYRTMGVRVKVHCPVNDRDRDLVRPQNTYLLSNKDHS